MYFKFPNIRHLRLFQEVAHQGGISAASKVIHLSQPAITQAISKLEEQLEVKLFVRLSDGMHPTEPGQIFLDRVHRMFAELAAGAEEAQKRMVEKKSTGFENFDRMVTAAQLRALIALADAENFSIAARNAGISQPTIHRAGRDLEQLAGTQLFKTVSHGIELTTIAKLLARRVCLAAAELQQGFDEIATFKGQESTSITVGSMPLARTWILPKVIHSVLQEKPGLRILTIDGPFPELLRGLRHGEIDFLIGALRDPKPAKDVVQEVLFSDPLALVVRAGHPLLNRGEVAIQDTLDYTWIAPPLSTPTGSYLDESILTSELKRSPVRVVSSSLVLVRGLLLAGDYVTIASLHQIRHELEQGIIVPLPIKLADSSRPIGLTYRTNWQPTKTQNLFLDHLRSIRDSISKAALL